METGIHCNPCYWMHNNASWNNQLSCRYAYANKQYPVFYGSFKHDFFSVFNLQNAGIKCLKINYCFLRLFF